LTQNAALCQGYYEGMLNRLRWAFQEQAADRDKDIQALRTINQAVLDIESVTPLEGR
jgi:hypothetical protein